MASLDRFGVRLRRYLMPFCAVVLFPDRLLGDALASLLKSAGRCQEVTTVSDPRAAVAAMREHSCDFLIADLSHMKDSQVEYLSGAQRYAGFPLFAISMGVRTKEVEGIDLLPEPQLQSLLQAIGSLSPRNSPIGGKGRMRNHLGLSPREMQVALLVAKGRANRDISGVVGLKEQSVKNLVSVIMRKLKCENRTQVALLLNKSQ